jgi:type I restriction enzyme S subunit
MRERSLYNCIKSEQISDRIDSEYYTKDLLANEQKLARFSEVRLCDLVDKSKPNNIADLTSNGSFEFLRGIEFNEKNGISFIRTQNLMDGYVDDGDVIYVNQECRSMVAKSLCETGDLIVCRKGKVGAASALPEKMNGAAISENVTRFSLQADDDADFFAAFLNSNQGRKRFFREATGVIQKWINNEKLREIKIIRLKANAEKYIGDKVRQAERLRAWAKVLDGKLTELESLIPLHRPATDERKHAIAALNYLTDNRLDAKFYERKHLALESQFNDQFRRLGAITTGFKYGASVEADYVAEEDGISFIRGNAVSKNNINTGDIVFLHKRLTNEISGSRIKTGEVLITRSGTVGVACDVFDEVNGSAYGSFIIKCQPRAELVLPTYLAWFLNSWVGQHQFRRWENGAVQLNINIEELSSIMVWIAPSDTQTQIVELIDAKRRSDKLSRNLTIAAKYLVEALIEGQLDQSQLIAAEQALQSENDQLDRGILNRLKTDSFDGQRQALFSDLDELCLLLAQAEEA